MNSLRDGERCFSLYESISLGGYTVVEILILESFFAVYTGSCVEEMGVLPGEVDGLFEWEFKGRQGGLL